MKEDKLMQRSKSSNATIQLNLDNLESILKIVQSM